MPKTTRKKRQQRRRQPRTKKQRREQAEARRKAIQSCRRCTAGAARAATRGEAPALHWCAEHRPKGEGLAKAVAAHERIQADTDRAVGRLVAYSGIGWAKDGAMRICAALAPILEAMAERKAERDEIGPAEEFEQRMAARRKRISQEWATEGHRVVWGDSDDPNDYELQAMAPQIPGWSHSKTERNRWDLGHTSISVAKIPNCAHYARTYEIRVYSPAGENRDPDGRRYLTVPCSPYLEPGVIKRQVSRWAKRHGLHAAGWRVKRSAAEASAPIRPAGKTERTNDGKSIQQQSRNGSQHR